jgi:hypothetical protein
MSFQNESQIDFLLTYFSEKEPRAHLPPPIHPSGQPHAALPKAHEEVRIGRGFTRGLAERGQFEIDVAKKFSGVLSRT